MYGYPHIITTINATKIIRKLIAIFDRFYSILPYFDTPKWDDFGNLAIFWPYFRDFPPQRQLFASVKYKKFGMTLSSHL